MKLNFAKMGGLMPAIVQDAQTGKVLMLGFMNEKALHQTQQSGKVTFYSRSKKKLWTKGETSGNFLNVQTIIEDCDADTLLIKVKPDGPACHSGQDTCFGETNAVEFGFLSELEKIIGNRKKNSTPGSYTCKLFEQGIKKIAQKLGEEATETAIEAVSGDKERVLEESADLLYHLLVILKARDLNLASVVDILKIRHES